MGNWLHTELLAPLDEGGHVFVISMFKRIQYPIHVTVIVGGFLVELFTLCWTCWTFGRGHTGCQYLLRIVHDCKSEQRVATTKSAIPAHHGSTTETNFLEWTENAGEACMVEIRVHSSPRCFVCDMFELRCWEVAEEDIAVTGGLSASNFRYVANR